MVALAIWPLVFAVVGALVYAFATNPKLARIGEIVFACGFLVLTFVLASQTWHLPPK